MALVEWVVVGYLVFVAFVANLGASLVVGEQVALLWFPWLACLWPLPPTRLVEE